MIWLEGGDNCAINRKIGTSTGAAFFLTTVGWWVCTALFAENATASTIDGINHTDKSINGFSVNGRSGLDVIGPYQGGGGGCCYIAPATWVAGMTVKIVWETGASVASPLADEFPGFADEAKYDVWLDKLEAQRRKHTKTVPIPDYTNQKTCGITVHFLPCDELQVTTSCYAYGNPNYPIKTPLKLPEPQSCPR